MSEKVRAWVEANVRDLSGRRIVITGANSGVGFESARIFAAKNAEVILACRSAEKGARAEEALRQECPNARVSMMRLDLSDLQSVAEFAQRFRARYPDGLDVLLNNAGVMALPTLQHTKDGFEMQFGTNHLGHFALTGQLLPSLFARERSRVVSVSSVLHRQGRISFTNLNAEKRYAKWPAYQQSKIANLYFAYELDRRLRAAGRSTISLAAHPGVSDTNLGDAGYNVDRNFFRSIVVFINNNIFAQHATMGALPLVHAAAVEGVNGGEYYGPNGIRNVRGFPARNTSVPRTHDEEIARKLWQASVELTHESYAALKTAT